MSTFSKNKQIGQQALFNQETLPVVPLTLN